MTLNVLFHRVSVEPLSETELEQVARDFGLSLSALCDAFAKEVGEGYLLGKYSWDLGDAAMNNIFSSAYVNADFGLSDFARRVFEAFDEGEYVHGGEPAELDGEPRTKSLLAEVLKQRTA